MREDLEELCDYMIDATTETRGGRFVRHLEALDDFNLLHVRA
jgi:hypothetical protein